MRIGISADSTSDLPKEFVEKYDIRLNAMPFSLGEDDLRHDGVTGTTQDVFDYVERTGKLPTTSAFNEFEYTEHFENILKDYDAVIHFSFSWGITSTGLNARRAAENMQNVYTIDSQTISCGISMLIVKCAELIKEHPELTPVEVVERMEALRDKVEVAFLLDTLTYMHKGGRCSGVANISTKLLSIKPKISVVNGKMEVTKKYMGSIDSCSLKCVDEVLKDVPAEKDLAFIIYSTPISVQEKVKQKLLDYGIKKVVEVQVGPSISIHCGKKAFGIAYMAE